MYEQLIIVGNLGNDPEMKFTASGVPVTTFSVAVNRKWTNNDGTPGEETKWFRVTVWRKLAETCAQYLAKGRQVMVIGRVAASAFSGQDGSPRASLEVTADTVRFIGGGNGRSEATMGGNGGISAHSEVADDEEIPF
jgi:single-strand DNA-binding protein